MKVGGQIPWNVTPICETSQIYYLMGRRLMKDVLGNHLKDQLFHVGHWLSIALFLRKTSQESINLERKSYLDCSSDTLCTREEFARVTYWLQTLRSWKRWTHQKSTLKDSMQRHQYFPKKMEIFIFPAEGGPITLSGRDQELRTSALIRERPIRGEGHIDFLGESGCRWNDEWFLIHVRKLAITLNQESNFTRREKKSFPTPLKYKDVSRTTHPNLDVKQERRIDDYWNINGSIDLSDPWTGLTQFTPLGETRPNGYMWSRERLTRKQLTSRPDHLWPQLWTKNWKKCSAKGEAEVVTWKTSTR